MIYNIHTERERERERDKGTVVRRATSTGSRLRVMDDSCKQQRRGGEAADLY